ncbi:MAG TPA: efflux RND transporter periplasmic adaptor subunit [Polyangiaceae bacterium]
MNTQVARPDGATIIAMAQARRRRAWLLRIALLAVLVAGAAGGLVWWRKHQQVAKTVRFITQPVKTGDLRETVIATGTLKGLDSVDIGAQISGRVSKVYVDFNDHVKVGQVLAEIDPESLKSRVDQSRAQVNASDAALALAKATAAQTQAQYARATDMSQKGLMSSKDLEAAKADAERATASVVSSTAQTTLSRASLKDAQTQLGYAIITSPIDGVVLARLVQPGQTVAASLQSPVLFTVASDLTKLTLYIDVDEADVGRVKEEQDATFAVDAWPDKNFTSKVLSVHNLPTTASVTVITYQAVLSVDNTTLMLRPGMTATATVTTAQHPGVLLVPNAALRFQPPAQQGNKAGPSAASLFSGGAGMARPSNQRGSSPKKKALTDAQGAVYVLENGRPKRLVIDIGGTDGERTEVKAGLAAGTEVITDVDERSAK